MTGFDVYTDFGYLTGNCHIVFGIVMIRLVVVIFVFSFAIT